MANPKILPRYRVVRGEAKPPQTASRVVRHYWHVFDTVLEDNLPQVFGSRDEARASIPGKQPKASLQEQPWWNEPAA